MNLCFDLDMQLLDEDDSDLEIITELIHSKSPSAVPAPVATASLIDLNPPLVEPLNPSKKSKKPKNKSLVQESELKPSKHPIGWFSDAKLEDYVQTIYKEVLEPLALKSPQLVYLMHTSNQA